MGLFSSIGNAFKSVTKKVSDFVSPVTNLWNKVSPIAEPLMSWFGTEKQNDLNSAQAARSMAFSSQEAEKNRAFQERMSNSAWQRGMDDMRKAGLNPIFAYQQGGASTPSGAQGVGSQANMGNALGNAASSALSSRMARQQWFKMQAETDNIDQSTNTSLQQQKTEQQKTIQLKHKNEILQELKDVLKKKSEFESENEWLIYIKSLSEALGAAFGAGSSAASIVK